MTLNVLLAGDVGGTKTKLGVFSFADPRDPLAEATFASARYRNLESLVKEFLGQNRVRVSFASFGVAGPVVRGEARITNLSWTIQEKKLAKALNIPSAHLLNDVAAIATAVPFLSQSDTSTLNAGEDDSEGARAVVAPGTGLGEAFITRDKPGHRDRVHASEGGHADFAPNNDEQHGLLKYLREKSGHVSYEMVCSGIGIRNIHEYFDRTNPGGSGAWHRNPVAGDPVPLMAAAALNGDKRCENCVRAFEMFVSILGAEAGNLALKVFATGGVFLAGGIPRKIMPLLESKSFTSSFTRKGRLSDVVSRIPVKVVLNPRAALLGAARSGMEQAELLNPHLAQEAQTPP